MDNILGRLKTFDAYPKTLEDFRTKTYGGALITLFSGIIMTLLFMSELKYYLTTEVSQELIVDTTRGEKMKIYVDVTFPKIGCAFLSIDAMDVSGESQLDVIANIYKQRLDLEGNQIQAEPEKHDISDKSKDTANKTAELDPNRCESCYGAETVTRKCCNTCTDVRDAYRDKGWAFGKGENIEQCIREGFTQDMQNSMNEGCKIYGYLLVSKVAGNFHIAPGKSFTQSHVHVHDLNVLSGSKICLHLLMAGLAYMKEFFVNGNLFSQDMENIRSLNTVISMSRPDKWDTSHSITHVGFGDDYPGLVNPLDGSAQTADKDMMMYTYYVKIVPTVYSKVSGEVLYSNQFSVTKHFKSVGMLTGETGLPGAFFIYEFSPMMVKYQEKQRSFFHFLTSVCAIVGGVFTVAGLIDALVYHSSRAIQKKIELGKFS